MNTFACRHACVYVSMSVQLSVTYMLTCMQTCEWVVTHICVHETSMRMSIVSRTWLHVCKHLYMGVCLRYNSVYPMHAHAHACVQWVCRGGGSMSQESLVGKAQTLKNESRVVVRRRTHTFECECDVKHSNVASLLHVPCIRGMTPSCLWHASFTCQWHASFTCATWPIANIDQAHTF